MRSSHEHTCRGGRFGSGPPLIDLDTYLSRIGPRVDPRTDFASLEALHVAHLGAIPFENVDVRLRRPIRLDIESLQAKLVRRKRGGYCFEQNTLFAAALRALGFEVETLEARVRPRGESATLPRTHMTLRVVIDGRDWLADVGFGGDGPLLPVPLDGTVSEQPDGGYVVGREGGGVHVLRRQVAGEWSDMYAFTLTPALPIDFEVASFYTSTYPASPFLNTLTAQRSRPAGRHILRGRTYTERPGAQETLREIAEDEIGDLLRDTFGLDVTNEEARLALGEV